VRLLGAPAGAPTCDEDAVIVLLWHHLGAGAAHGQVDGGGCGGGARGRKAGRGCVCGQPGVGMMGVSMHLGAPNRLSNVWSV
jgi:hypothetical protein